MKRHISKVLPSIMFLLLVLVALTGCIHKHGTVPVVAPGKYSIQIWKQGPFLDDLTHKEKMTSVMLRTDEHEGVFALDSSHPVSPNDNSCQVTYVFELHGVDPTGNEPIIDPAFGALHLKPHHFRLKTDNRNFFIRLNTPTLPAAIRHVGALMPVVFSNGQHARVPLTQVLEFTATDLSNVHLTTTQIETCGTTTQSKKLADQLILSCSTLKERYEDYWKENPKDPEEPQYSARGPIKHELESCSDNTYVYFIGAGVHPGSGNEDHGIQFFNTKILPFVFGDDSEKYKDKVIKAIGKGAEPRTGDNDFQSPRYVQIDFRRRRSESLYVPVASTENCKSPGAIVP